MTETTSPSRRRERDIRPEIQALRAVAVGAVILFHLWPDTVPGGFIGVDVFFVISGFLITAHLLREVASTGRIRLREFWARRIRRLLPAAFLVLIASFVATLLILPEPAWQRVMEEIAAASAYVLNWLLAANAVDYFAAENAASPVQHYWSLSVEEQFYLLWPLLLLGLAVLAGRRARDRSRVLAVGVGGVFVFSLAASIVAAVVAPTAGYFWTFTHAWEFALGGGLALGAPLLSRAGFADRSRLRAVIGWGGFAVIVASSFVFTGSLPFPGAIALIPTLGAAAVIVAGTDRRTRMSPRVLTERRPVQWLGDVSYSAYLWHWPPIVLLPVLLDHPLGLTSKLVILAATLALAFVTKRFVEDPVRRWPRFAVRPRASFAFAASGAVLLLIGSATSWVVVQQRVDAVSAQSALIADQVMNGTLTCFGAAAALDDTCDDQHVIDPDLVYDTSLGDGPGWVTQPLAGALSYVEFGNPDSDTTIALIGDSHAAHYLPALTVLASVHDWRIILLKVNGCSPSTLTWQSSSGPSGQVCEAWRTDLLDRLPDIEGIDAIVTSSVAPRYGRTETPEVQQQIADAFTQMWAAWVDAGIPVVVIADVPGPGDEVGEARECVAAHAEEPDPCTAPRAVVLEKDAMVVAATQHPRDGLQLLDFTEVYCGPEICHAVVGGVGVYSSGAHIARTFALSLAPFIEPALLDALAEKTLP